MAATLPDLTLEEWSLLQARLLWGYDGLVAPENLSQISEGRMVSAWWLKEGEVEVDQGGQRLRARSGEWIFTGPARRQQSFAEGTWILSINFILEWPSGDPVMQPFFAVSAKDHPELAEAAVPAVRFIERQFPGVRVDLGTRSAGLREYFGLQRLFAEWMVVFLEVARLAGVRLSRMAGMDQRVLNALRKLDRHAWGERFREEDLARQVGLSAGHLDRLFIRQIGVSPRGYLQKRRLESATALLADQALPIKKIAYDLGFSSPAHFCHWFRQATGSSPRGYRQGRAR